jgi:glycerol-3-phosphate responsive antiterminator
LPKRLSLERPEVLQVVPGLVPKSESKLTKREESELIERLYMLGSEWGVQFSEKVA